MAETNWVALLEEEDAEGLWNSLYQLVSRHPSVRPLRFATDETAVASEFEVNADLTQELFLELFQKQRFDHYVAGNYTSSEIENELTHIELPNLVGARLRKRYPESFRMARRVSTLLKTSSSFQAFDATASGRRTGRPTKAKTRKGGKARLVAANGAVATVHSSNGRIAPFKQNGPVGRQEANWDDEIEAVPEIDPEGLIGREPGGSQDDARASEPERRQRMVNHLYGLKKWTLKKSKTDPGLFQEIVRSSVPVRNRDTRIVGRSATSQLILSNGELEKLIVEIFEAIDSPADVKTIRQLTLSRIPLQDYNIAALDSKVNGDGNDTSTATYAQGAPDDRMTPEQELIEEERNRAVKDMAQEFLQRLFRVVNNNSRRYDRLVKTLWHCYYDPEEPSQLEIAKLLGVSDSLVSDNRKIIEYELRMLRLSLEDASVFSEALLNLAVKRVRTNVGAIAASGSARKFLPESWPAASPD